jgi:hypothetical protein
MTNLFIDEGTTQTAGTITGNEMAAAEMKPDSLFESGVRFALFGATVIATTYGYQKVSRRHDRLSKEMHMRYEGKSPEVQIAHAQEKTAMYFKRIKEEQAAAADAAAKEAAKEEAAKTAAEEAAKTAAKEWLADR